MNTRRFIRWFQDIGIGDVGLVGGKNASLGEMYRELTSKGVRIPNGFAVTADGYRHFLKASGLDQTIATMLRGLDTRNYTALAERGHKVRDAILAASLPDDLQREIVEAYGQLCEQYGPQTDTAVRSSATAEDLPTASFAGQQESYLNVRGASGGARSLPGVHRILVHRSGHLLPRRQGVRPHGDRPVGRHSKDGSLGPGFGGRVVHARNREWLCRGGADQQFLRPGRKRGQGSRRSRRVPGVQAHAQAGPPRHPQAQRRQQAGKTHLHHPRRPQHPDRAGAGRGPAATESRRRRRAGAGPMGLFDRGALLGQGRPPGADGYRMGQGRQDQRAVHSASPARDGACAGAQEDLARNLSARAIGARCCSKAAASARRSAPARRGS